MIYPENIGEYLSLDEVSLSKGCGKSNNLQIDHIVSNKEEEPDNPNLYQTLCGVCNR